jgi:hypothetical protein
VPYRSKPGGFTISVPEGWARALSDRSIRFGDKLNSITISWKRAPGAPTTTRARTIEVPELERGSTGFRLKSVGSTTLPAGRAVLIVYEVNSAPNPVTNKRYRLVVERFELYHDGREVILSLSSPVGADNVDAWRTVSESLSWS